MNTLKRFIINPIRKIGDNANQKPLYGALVVIATYFIFDAQFMDPYRKVQMPELLVGVIISIALFAVIYLAPQLETTQNRKRTLLPFIILSVLTLSITLGYDVIMPKLLPHIFEGYKIGNVVTVVIIAPILEELAFRYLLYDKWARPKFGKLKGILLISLVFIITHPIMNMTGFALYWLPTLFFFSVYDLGGIYPAILAHMLFNILAIL